MARALLADGELGGRAVARDAASGRARALADPGADLVEAETIGATIPVASGRPTASRSLRRSAR
ncbi:hypothetical protein DMB66_46260 [Actinoplanes sp. ATCC 53533]|uniref:hypothetical protein n=1 Tax=Actinoplanes sp. ATCC 53533 TaxID=1288362 RepID=UPI000F78BD81|nr:hypothetical protein [Actinoplanes sp. ATCC 53533]RSM48491.1 hypothetical protein DMB66_46260 [Actinoplanes sp. ATCC 53533]